MCEAHDLLPRGRHPRRELARKIGVGFGLQVLQPMQARGYDDLGNGDVGGRDRRILRRRRQGRPHDEQRTGRSTLDAETEWPEQCRQVRARIAVGRWSFDHHVVGDEIAGKDDPRALRVQRGQILVEWHTWSGRLLTHRRRGYQRHPQAGTQDSQSHAAIVVETRVTG